ncbi:Uncharacterized protein C6F6.19 [Zea mays]|uniref:D111/G-patch domain-containing protein n=2 Tax=Zea mays TaxID=4577 RepID=B4FA30_MAIZE|nr:uncharacterized protein LOC100191767 [Zea mays]XP_035822081.1 uncharacterized protein LOC100191767 isoform X1 [Zea mays]XP_035822099.1 uncharacterized protein LOC100191767 isoform X1 [Zea mays]XP_035822111.1 uncharacterized protein LOC100191767 isoform X1 [Zea mays]XP_035822117.1 uncharacterized protein LOC100191767 isoform X1 [Zea mays]XP_035822128.1 uncharacterized protein LOC100191767 isoform X1 [Zea mays]XP_035822134.1 uncharacterized protein LOC100191767 isoform X1 [Zea mays]ACF78973|eukprot:NP_001130664.1 nucleic acid binding protein [Zea mays]
MEPDADEDYMGDLSRFLPPSPSSSPPKNLGRRKQPSTQAQAQPRAKRGKGVPWQERRRQERERKQREEDARTMAGLAEAIPESNVGFRMLRQMGYDPDSRAGAGAEPVGIEIRRSRAGLGAEEPVLAPAPAPAPVEKPREVSERERRQQEEMAVELRARKSTQWKGRRVVWDYRKAERALAQLENREVEPQAPEGEDKEKGAEEEEDVITEEDLQQILSKLRDQYQYCLYCGCKYESLEVLSKECPGPDEDDH